MNLFDVQPAVGKDKLFRRDRMNLVTACAGCNGRKAARTPEEARMPLLYLPYVPSRFEDFLLAGRNIRADVHEWLSSRLPKASRLN